MLEIKKYYVDTVFIMLGFSCNLHCSYCLQHAYKKIQSNNKSYNKDIITYLKKLSQKLGTDGKLHIQFFGGEPLVYFTILEDIVKQMSNENVTFGIITNGILITDEISKFLSEYNFDVTISWDGECSLQSRGIDVFKVNKENIFKLKNRFGISSVYNGYTTLRKLLSDINSFGQEYKKIYGTKEIMPFNIDNLYNFGNTSKEVFNIDFNQAYKDTEFLIKTFINDIDTLTEAEINYVSRIIGTIDMYQEYDEKFNNKFVSSCANGINVQNIDLDGNLYLCHNDITKKLGDIYSSEEEYLNAFKIHNSTYPSFYKKYCKDCFVRFACNGGCMMVGEEERLKYYCPQRKSFYEPIIKSLLKINEGEYK